MTPEGPLAVVAGPDGQPVLTPDGMLIPIDPPVPLAPPRRRGRGRGRVAADSELLHEHVLHVEVPEPHSAGAHPGAQRAPYWMDETRRRAWEREQDTGAPVPAPSSARHYRHEYERERERGPHEHSVGGSPPPSASGPLNSAQVSPIDAHPQAMRSSHHYPVHRHSHGHGHAHHSQHSHSHSHSHSGSPHSPTGPHAAASYPTQRMHHHQRIGPGSNVIRERERRDREADGGDVPMASEDNRSDGHAPVSRVPTPPYMRRSGPSRDVAEQGALDRDREREHASQGPSEAYAAPPSSEHARSRSNSHTPN